MPAPWSESSGLLPWMLLAIICAAITALFSFDIVSLRWISTNKDLITALSSIATVLALGVAGLLSYLRFFRGRWLLPKLTIVPTTGLIPLESENLHWIDIAFENRGAVSIWNYQIEVRAMHIYSDSTVVRNPVDVLIVKPDKIHSREHLIDVGETHFEHALLRVPKEVVAVSYQIRFTDKYESRWDRSITSPNAPIPVIR